MITAPVLAMPDFSKPFILETDASATGIGAVLMQERKPIAYLSKGIGIKAQGLSTYEKEFLALLTAVQKWRHYLVGGPFVIRTDQISLKHLLEQRVNHMMQHKGLCKLMGLDYRIEYKKGVENKVADALSRQQGHMKEEEAEVRAVSELVPQWVEEVKSSYRGDPWIKRIEERNSQGDPDNKFTKFQGIWRYKGRICVGSQQGWREKLIQEMHATSLGGHSGVLASYKRLKAIFHWPHMKEEVHQHIQQCEACQQNKHETVKLPGLLQPLPVPEEAWSSISMNFISGLPKSEGKDVIMVVVDRLTKYAHFLALKHPFKASEVALKFMEGIYRLHGLLRNIVSDRDPIFTSKFWQELMLRLGVKLNMGTAYHPQSDGQTERVNQCIESYLRCMLFNQAKNWSKWLPLAEWWYNTNYHSSLKTTPFQALYGYAPPQLAVGSPPRSVVEGVNELLRERQVWIQALRDNLRKAQERMKKFADENREERKFKEGDWVYLKLQPYRQLSVQGRKNQKLAPRFYGPFEVLTRIGTVAYELKLPPGSQIHPVFHVSQLKARVGSGQAVTPGIPLSSPQQQLKEIPEGILGRRMIKRNNAAVPQLLIKWENGDEEDASWEDYETLKAKFPNFILRDKDLFKEGGVSGNEINLLVAVGKSHSVNRKEGKEVEKGQLGQATEEGGVSQADGARMKGQEIKGDRADLMPVADNGPKSIGTLIDLTTLTAVKRHN